MFPELAEHKRVPGNATRVATPTVDTCQSVRLRWTAAVNPRCQTHALHVTGIQSMVAVSQAKGVGYAWDLQDVGTAPGSTCHAL